MAWSAVTTYMRSFVCNAPSFECTHYEGIWKFFAVMCCEGLLAREIFFKDFNRRNVRRDVANGAPLHVSRMK